MGDYTLHFTGAKQSKVRWIGDSNDLVLGSWDSAQNTLQFMRYEQQEEANSLHELYAVPHDGAVMDLLCAELDGRESLLSVSTKGSLFMWQKEAEGDSTFLSEEPRWDIKYQFPAIHSGPATAVAKHPTQDLVASVGEDGKVVLTDMVTQQPTIREGGATMADIQFSPSSGMIYATAGATVQIWDSREGARPHQVLEVSSSPIETAHCLCITDNAIFAGDSIGVLHQWDRRKFQEFTPLRGHSAGMWELQTFPHSAQIISCSEDGTLTMWRHTELASRQVSLLSLQARLWDAQKPINSVSIQSELRGQPVACCTDSEALWIQENVTMIDEDMM